MVRFGMRACALWSELSRLTLRHPTIHLRITGWNLILEVCMAVSRGMPHDEVVDRVWFCWNSTSLALHQWLVHGVATLTRCVTIVYHTLWSARWVVGGYVSWFSLATPVTRGRLCILTHSSRMTRLAAPCSDPWPRIIP